MTRWAWRKHLLAQGKEPGVRLIITRSSHRGCSVKRVVLKNFANFTGKHLYWSLFLVTLQGLSPATFLKRDSNTGFPAKFVKFLEHLFWRTPVNGCSSITFFHFCSEWQSIAFDVVCWMSGQKMEKSYEKTQENRSQKK